MKLFQICKGLKCKNYEYRYKSFHNCKVITLFDSFYAKNNIAKENFGVQMAFKCPYIKIFKQVQAVEKLG